MRGKGVSWEVEDNFCVSVRINSAAFSSNSGKLVNRYVVSPDIAQYLLVCGLKTCSNSH